MVQKRHILWDEALLTGTTALGVKGPSWICNVYPDIIKGNAIDYKQCVLLGDVRRILVLWFDPKFSAMSFSLSSVVSVVYSKLAKLNQPTLYSVILVTSKNSPATGKPLNAELGFLLLNSSSFRSYEILIFSTLSFTCWISLYF